MTKKTTKFTVFAYLIVENLLSYISTNF